MPTHALKTVPKYFAAIETGEKTFEVRKADRSFKVGDRLLLQEYNPDDKIYTGKEWEGTITYLMDDPDFVKKGFVVFGIQEFKIMTGL